MNNPLLLTLLATAVLGGIAAVLLLRLRIVFVIELRDGRARVRAGRPPEDFPAACEDVARRRSVPHGRITGVRDGSSVRLTFSRDIPESSHQAFRNVWTPPPPRGGPPGGGMRARGG